MNECELMLTSILDCDRIHLTLGTKILTNEQQVRFDQMKARRNEGEPLQYIIGQTEFMGLSLSVDERVLIPRPETEILVDLILQRMTTNSMNGSINVLDLGVGSGNISIAMAKNIPHSLITAVDISEGALTVAAENVNANGVGQRVRLVRADMADFMDQATHAKEKFDLVISNPPYIRTDLRDQLPGDVQREPWVALNGGPDGLDFYKKIIGRAYHILKPDGLLFLEIGDGQRSGIEKIFSSYPQYAERTFYKDYVGTDRIVMAGLT